MNASRTLVTVAHFLLIPAIIGAGIAGCPQPDVGGVDFGISEAEHDLIYYPISANNDAALTLQGECGEDEGNPCPELTGSHQCSSDDINNPFARPFCQPDDPFQARQPSLQGSYACEQCHSNSGSLKVARCAECHLQLPIVPPGDPRDPDGAKSPDERHRHVGGLAIDTPTCASCHAENFDIDRDGAFDRNDFSPENGDRVDGHLPFGIALGFAHYRVACGECHGSARADKTWALDFTQFTCAGCHAGDDLDAIHTDDGAPRGGIEDYDGPDEATCLFCHADGRTPPF